MNRQMKLTASIVAVALLLVAGATFDLWRGAGTFAETPANRVAVHTSTQPRSADAGPAQQLSEAFRAAARRVLPSVVTIESRAQIGHTGAADDSRPFGGQNPFEGTPFEDFFKNSPFDGQSELGEGDQGREIVGMGSGVIIDPRGVILTNNHVVDGSEQVTVRLSDGRVLKASEVKSDPKSDLAIVRIDGGGELSAAQFGDSDRMEVGDWVLALGQPFGLESTVTAGIISAKHRDIGIGAREHYFQTDAAINPGNSGGPLVNLAGEVIAINTAISSRSGGNEGVGFAVPSNLARWVSDQLMERGSVRRAYLGVGIQSLTPELAEQFGLKSHQGALVTKVLPDTPAAQMGLRGGDVITAIDGAPVSTALDLQLMVEGIELEKAHKMTVIRDGQDLSLDYHPEIEPKNYGRTAQSEPADDKHSTSELVPDFGMRVTDLTPELTQQLGVERGSGVVIAEVDRDGIAARAGLRPGMVISQINRQPVHTAAEVNSVLTKASVEKGVLLLLQTQKGSMYVVLKKQ